jgi:RyR domain-containing protein
MNIETIARICHKANKALCESIGDFSQKSWNDAEGWQKESAIKGVEFVMRNPDLPASVQHDAWMKDKLDAGWKYGPVNNAETKEHPYLVPFYQLPVEEQAKDRLFKSIVSGLARYIV